MFDAFDWIVSPRHPSHEGSQSVHPKAPTQSAVRRPPSRSGEIQRANLEPQLKEVLVLAILDRTTNEEYTE